MHLLHCKGQSLKYSPGQGNPPGLRCGHCMWGRGPKGNSAACSALTPLSVTSSATQKGIKPFRCWFLGGWVCVHCRIPWVPAVDSPVRLGVSPTAVTPTGFYSQRFWGFIFGGWNPGLYGLSHPPVVPPSLSTSKCWTAQFSSCCLASRPLAWLPLSARPTSLDKCFFFNSLVVGLHTVWFSGSSGFFGF